MDTLRSPYSGLEPRAFWRSGVSERERYDPGELYRPKFPLNRSMRIATAGSCFAQHVGRALSKANFNVIDAEPMPPEIPDNICHKYGYRMFSARYGNIYTARQMVQLLEEAYGISLPMNGI